jgi:hypothetical protein
LPDATHWSFLWISKKASKERAMNRILLATLIVSLLFAAACTSQPTEDPPASPAAPEVAAAETIDLFNGQDLKGWKSFLVDPNVEIDAVWSVRDGILICKGEPLGYLYTSDLYTSFDLVVEWRWAPGTEPGNSGVLMRVNGEPRQIPRGYEAQLMSGSAGDLYGFHGMPMDGPADRTSRTEENEVLGDFVGVKKVKAAENEPGEWNRYDIHLEGGDLSVRVNGTEVNEANSLEALAGPIGLQSEGGEIHFRKVLLTPLS